MNASICRPLVVAFSLALFQLCPSGSGPASGQVAGRPPVEVERRAMVGGLVMDHDTGDPLGGAAVSLAPGGAGVSGMGTRVSNAQGRFLFEGVPPGLYRLSVTLLGYHSLSDTIRVSGEGDLDLSLPLSTDPIPLEPIVVVAERERFIPGYQGRDIAGAGPYLLTREEIERRHPLRVTDVLASVPGARVLRRSNLQSVVLLRGGCVPTLVLDGIRIANVEGIDRVVNPGDVESLRVYHGAELPVRYGLNHCGGVVIETRQGPDSEGGNETGGGAWRWVALVGMVVFGAFMMR